MKRKLFSLDVKEENYSSEQEIHTLPVIQGVALACNSISSSQKVKVNMRNLSLSMSDTSVLMAATVCFLSETPQTLRVRSGYPHLYADIKKKKKKNLM